MPGENSQQNKPRLHTSTKMFKKKGPFLIIWKVEMRAKAAESSQRLEKIIQTFWVEEVEVEEEGNTPMSDNLEGCVCVMTAEGGVCIFRETTFFLAA